MRSMIRHKRSVGELSLLMAWLLVALYFVFQVDVFVTEGTESRERLAVELDEALLVGGLLAIGLLIFATRRYLDQKRETARRIAAERHAHELAFHDGLTGLPNRRQFAEALRVALGAPPRAGASHGVFLLDLNGFKQINDVHGHAIGDETLTIIAQRLLGAMRDGDLVARFGGDEFAILARHLAGPEAAANVALRVIQALDVPVVTGHVQHEVGAGIGIALVPGDASDAEEALRKADVALYRAKAERRSAMRFFEERMDVQIAERDQMEVALRTALRNGEITTVYEPSVDLRSQVVVGFEASPRWTHPVLGEIPPHRFIPIAEETGLIHELADRVLCDGCKAAVQWPSHVILSLDIYSTQFKDHGLKKRIEHILQSTGLPPQRLELEITESLLVQNMEAAQELLGALRQTGIRIALDNFGTGYSSLYHLRSFRLDKVKIDRTFIEESGDASQRACILRALIGLGQGLGLTVAVDGIGDVTQHASLLDAGAEQAQGGHFSHAVTAEATLALLVPDETEPSRTAASVARGGKAPAFLTAEAPVPPPGSRT